MSRRTSCCTPSWPLLDHRVWAVHPRLTVPAPGALLGRPRSPDLAALSAGRGIGAARRSKACLLHVKEKPHISRRGAFSTGGGALRWPSGSTLVRIDGPPSFRAVHPPLLTGGPADSDSTGSPNRSQHRRVGAVGRTRPTRGTEPDGFLSTSAARRRNTRPGCALHERMASAPTRRPATYSQESTPACRAVASTPGNGGGSNILASPPGG
jgi:hypothetical protein